MTRLPTITRLVGATLLFAVALGAQATTAVPDTTPRKRQLPPATVDTSKKKKQTLLTVRDAWLAVGVAGGVLALYPVDKSLAVKMQNENTAPGGKALNSWANGFDYLALPGVYIIAPAFYLAGRMTHNDKVKDLGWHTTEATIAGAAITEVLKGFVGRARPYVSADTNPHTFKFLSGFGNDQRASFPSGHATIAFAAAAAASSEVGREYPKLKWIVGPILYTSAAFVGLARMYQSQHWASDVVMGAGIGTFTGLKVVKYAHAHPDNWIDKIMIHTHVAPTPGGGGMLGWSSQF